jgi:hypothetical protein
VTVAQRVHRLSELEAIDLIDVGHHVYSRTRMTAREYPVGGLVWQVEPYADRETGEALRRFHVIRGDDGRWVFDTVDSAEVDTESLSPPRIDLIRSTIRQTLAQQLMRRGKKHWQREDQQIVAAMYALSKVLVPHA